ncbi:hypothetical protein ABKV19_005359 [Rosa sericea]
MQSSLSYVHGNRAFRFQANPNPISNQSPLRSHSHPQSPSLQNPKWPLPSTPFSSIAATTKKPQSSVAPVRSGISSNSFSANGKRSFRDWVEAVSEAVSNAFPIWVALGCLLGLIRPTSFNWVTPKLNFFGLTLTMLGMGMTLTFNDLRDALAMPKELFCGFFLQYSVMPLSGYFVSKLLNLPSHYAAGLILVACCPGGTASNIVTYIARGNVALSVLMTAASTVSAVIMTPFLTAKLAGQYVAVDATGMLFSTLQVSFLTYCHFLVVVALINFMKLQYALNTGCASSCDGRCISESVLPRSG